MINLGSNVSVRGCPGVVIQAATGLNRAATYFRIFGYFGRGDLENVSIEGLTFDLNGTRNLVPVGGPPINNQAIVVARGRRLRVANCTFLNNAGRQSVFFGDNSSIQSCRDIVIENCSFRDCGTAVPGNSNQTDHSSIYCQAIGAIIKGNCFSNGTVAPESTAIESHNFSSVCDGNTISNYGVALNIVALVNDQEDSVYSNILATGVSRGVDFFVGSGFRMQRVTISNSSFVQDANALTVCIDANSNIAAGSTFTDGQQHRWSLYRLYQ